MSNITKQTYARGIAEYLQRSGVTNIPTAGLLKQASAYASEAISVEPSQQAVPHEDAIKVAQHLTLFNRQLMQDGKTASGQPGVRIGNSERDAYGDLIEGIYKQAMNTSSTLTGKRNDQENLLSDSVNAEAKLDMEAGRTEGYANVGQGNTNLGETNEARIGQEQPHPKAPKAPGGASTNSVVQASGGGSSQSSNLQKQSSIQEALRKLATGMNQASTVTGDRPDQQNLLSDSVNSEAKMEEGRRPENYANVGQGNANINESQAANVGEETSHPEQPTHGGASGNSVTEASKQARWQRHFAETADEIGPNLPKNMPYDQKVAAVKQCMSMEPHEQETFLHKVAQAFTPQQPKNDVGSLLNGLSALQG